MKKLLGIIFIITCLVVISGCRKNDIPKDVTLDLLEKEVTLNVGNTYQIKTSVIGVDNPIFEYSGFDENLLSVMNGTIIAKNIGVTSITIKIKGYSDKSVSLNVVIKQEFIPTLSIEQTNYEIEVGNTITLNPVTNVDGTDIFNIKLSNDNLTIENLTLTAQKVGTTEVIISLKDYPEFETKIVVIVKEKFIPTLSIEQTNYEIEVGNTITLNPVTNVDGTDIFNIKLSNDNLTIENLTLTAQKVGTTEVIISLKDYPEFETKIVVIVKEKFIPTLSIEQTNYEIEVGNTITLNPVTNVDGTDIFNIKLSNDNLTMENLTLTAQKVGTTEVIISLKDYPEFKTKVIVIVNEKIVDITKPEFILDGVTENDTLSFGMNFDPLIGVTAIDDIDGDISELIEVIGTIDNKSYGKQQIEYKVVDKRGNVATMMRTIEVVWDYTVEFIGHSGSYFGVANSEEAFIYAASILKYQALECDVKQTSDGVFVMCHDDAFGGKTLANTTWNDLKDVEVTSKRASGYPAQYGEPVGTYTSKICTFERYLEICKEYNVKAVIELKSSKGITNSDQSRMPALMQVIKDKDMLDQVIFLGSAYNCLIWVKENGYNYIPCQYLVNSCESQSILDRCIQYGFDLSINVTGNYTNSEEWIAKYQDAGCKVSVWTFTQYIDYPEVQKWIDLGVDYVTCDWQRIEKLKLTRIDDLVTHKVTFKDIDGTILKIASVIDGRSAPAPTMLDKNGYEFMGWDASLNNITSDLEVNAIWKIINYNIKYEENLYTFTEESFASKEEFVNEYYNDLFNWIVTNKDTICGLTYSDGVYTLKTKDTEYGSFSFSSALDILDASPYYIEQTIGHFIYKPIVGENSQTYQPVVDDSYFLNSEPYRTKYINLNAYFLNVIKTSYPSYSDRYIITSSNKVQIFFRFHQWCNGTKIVAFDKYPTKFNMKYMSSVEVTMPNSPLTYTINDEIILPNPTSSIAFLGWYLNPNDENTLITKIDKGSTGDIVLYAKWENVVIENVYSKIIYNLNDGINSSLNKDTYLEGTNVYLSDPSKPGYKFKGWYLDIEGTELITMISEKRTGDVELYAIWDFDVFTVTYELNGGSWDNEITYLGEKNTSIVTTMNTNFWGNYKTDIFLQKKSSFVNAIYSFRVGIAFDELKGTYIVVNVAKSGENFTTSGVEYIVIISGDYQSYESTSNFRENVKVGQIIEVIGDLDTGKVTLNFYDEANVTIGIIENYISEYKINELPLLLPKPIKEGMIFKGWSLNSDLSGEIYLTLPISITGNLILYAVFE